MDQHAVFALVHDDLTAVQQVIDRHASSQVRIVDHLGRYAGNSGGKKLRPALVALTARMFGEPRPVLPEIASLVEFIHLASLVHDDVIDDAGTRRGRPSVNAAFGNEMSVLLGDWLYMTAFRLAVAQRDFRILEILLEAARTMVEGELIQLDLLGKAELAAAESLDIADRKTARLFSAAMQLGGVAAGQENTVIELLGDAGRELGLAFQLVDDVLDFTADERKLGKPKMNDLKEGKVTLPVIFLLEDGEPRHREMVETVLREGRFVSVSPETLLRELQSRGCLERTMELAATHARQARQRLQTLPASPCREGIVAISEFMIQRSY